MCFSLGFISGLFRISSKVSIQYQQLLSTSPFQKHLKRQTESLEMYSDPNHYQETGMHPFKQLKWNMQLTLKERGNKTSYIKGQNPYDICRKPTVKYPHIHKNNKAYKILFIILNNIRKNKYIRNIITKYWIQSTCGWHQRFRQLEKQAEMKIAMQNQGTLTTTRTDQRRNLLRNVELKCIEPSRFLKCLQMSPT